MEGHFTIILSRTLPPRRSPATCHHDPFTRAATREYCYQLLSNKVSIVNPRYNLQLKVDGVEVNNNKVIEYRDWETPYLNRIDNQ